jgi:polyhydroxyalkanoate synthase
VSTDGPGSPGGTPDLQAAQRELAQFALRAARGLSTLRAPPDAGDGCSPREAVYRDDKVTLYRYAPIAKPAGLAPLVICYALVNRPYMMDLQPDRSLIRRLLERGLDVYLIDWGYPDRADRFLELDDYVNGFLDGCVGHVLGEHRIESVNVLGVCQGGTFSLCYAALHPGRVRNLVTMVTPVDFQTPENLLSRWIRDVDVDALVEASGNVPGELLNVAYVSLMPFRLMQQKYVGLIDLLEDPQAVDNFMRMETWIFDSPDQAGEAFRQFAQWCFQENRLVRGTLELGGRKVDLANVIAPVLNVYGRQDHLVPPSASIPLQRYVGTRDYTALELDVGHIGMYVSGKSQKQLPEAIHSWLQARP